MVALTRESSLPAREDDAFPVAVHEQALHIARHDLIFSLLEDLGAPLIARITEESDGQTVAAWTRGASAPNASQEQRLRATYEIVQTLRAWERPDTIRAWFAGANPELGDASPTRVVARNPSAVLDAAYAFIAA